ncbi:MAG: rhodanese-like domain-containing protein [Gammaproteobacteria bacterium]|jgi:rhodanese-related sulfurtransferase
MQILEFLTNHWPLTAAFVVLLLLLILSELRGRMGSAQKVTPAEATLLINKEDALVIDLRDELAFKKGHIITAKHMIPTQILADTKLAQDKPILLTCQSGYQSPGIGRQLRQKGFQKVYYLAGGIDNWLNAGLLLTKGK